MDTLRSFDWLVSTLQYIHIFKLNQILTMALWNCFRENIWSMFIKIKETTFGFKHKALYVYESSLAHCVDEVSTNTALAYPSSFARLAQKPGNCGSSFLKKKNSTCLEQLRESTGKFWSECSRHAQADNLRNLDPPITFDFTLSFAIRRICIHSWLYYYSFKHCEVARMYSEATGVIHAK